MVTVLRVYTLYLTPSQDTIQLDANIITYKDLNDLEVVLDWFDGEVNKEEHFIKRLVTDEVL